MTAPATLDQFTAAWITTLSPDGSPHTTPVWFVTSANRVWVASSTANRKVANVGRDPRLSIAFDGSAAAPHVALGHAVLEQLADHAQIIARFASQYGGWNIADADQDGSRIVLEITIDRWLLGGHTNPGRDWLTEHSRPR